jgi:transcriptional regulator with XRE-family HTH domain
MILPMDGTPPQKPMKRRRLTKQDKLLADTLRQFRLARGYSQEALSERLGKNQAYIAWIETYRSGLSLATLYKVAKILGVKVQDFFTF